jgi:thiol-disulfide isomerase/thioredoxin
MRRSFALVVGLAFIAAACAPAGGAPTGGAPTGGAPTGGAPTGTPYGSPPTGTPSGSAPTDSAWRTATLRDVASGEEFNIDELRGKVVAIETMAIWCTTCRIQQREAQAALAQLDSAELVYIGLDIDPNERASDLADYRRQLGFEWTFVVASRDVARSLAADFGDQILSPPATPLITLDRDGNVVDVHVGVRSADELVSLFEAHLR